MRASSAAAPFAPAGVELLEHPERQPVRPLVVLVELATGPEARAEGGDHRRGRGEPRRPEQRAERGDAAREGRAGAEEVQVALLAQAVLADLLARLVERVAAP